VPPADDSQRIPHGTRVVAATEAPKREGTDGAEAKRMSNLAAVVFKVLQTSLRKNDEVALRNAFERAAVPA